MTSAILATGMFRSGTTLLARMLNAHPEIAFASDPFAPLYKAFRNEVARTISAPIDEASPLDDYYFSEEKQRLFARMQAVEMDEIQAPQDLDALRQNIAARAETFAPNVIPHLQELSGKTFSDLFASSHAIIERVYGDETSAVIGSKEVWVGEMVEPLLKKFDTAKVVYIVRDPRAVCASKNAAETHYPWTFLMRQWRKLSAIAWQLQQPSCPYKDRVYVVRYEDLIAEPERCSRELCDFLGVSFAEEIINGAGFRDDKGNPWRQNSTYASGSTGFNQTSIDRWRKVLSSQEVQLIDYVCGPEMELFGYQPETNELPYDLILSPPRVADERVAEWIVPFVETAPEAVMAETACEHVRRQALKAKANVSDGAKKRLCLFSELYDHLIDQQQ